MIGSSAAFGIASLDSTLYYLQHESKQKASYQDRRDLAFLLALSLELFTS